MYSIKAGRVEEPASAEQMHRINESDTVLMSLGYDAVEIENVGKVKSFGYLVSLVGRLEK
jgi:hypothetical protein